MMSSEFWNLLSTKSLKQIPKPEEGNIKLLSGNKETITLLWLDDRINPLERRMDWLAYSPIGRNVNVVWVKNYVDFKNWIQNNGLPGAICFDYDLGEKTPTGYDCAKWLVDYCQKNHLPPPPWASQSTNPEGKANINRLLKNYLNSF
ncbi:cyclic-phosphate processing receiver domain-containing protein [Gramella sp. MT6]|uniref:cyclic-phosphate processing receiver domain-containing protein n=1 Tax=Gramella sp. MT6 TaxID=2705471 RepID=UPI00214E598D|nr:cyclic-phosphate processing receiver domain-containing protein [Gramella sp. MT6]